MKKIFELINRNLIFEKFDSFFGRNNTLEKLPLITISREMGSGGRPIAYLIEKKLGKPWKVYHSEIVNQIAKESHLQEQLIKEIDEQKIPLIDEIVGDFFGNRYLNLSSYYRHLVKILSTIGARGYAIIVGRGAYYLLPHSLKVRIICEMDQRIEWIMSYENLSRTDAIRRIENSDEKRIEFEEAVYHHNPKKAHHYDMVIRTGNHLSIEDAADIIVFAAKKRFKI